MFLHQDHLGAPEECRFHSRKPVDSDSPGQTRNLHYLTTEGILTLKFESGVNFMLWLEGQGNRKFPNALGLHHLPEDFCPTICCHPDGISGLRLRDRDTGHKILSLVERSAYSRKRKD